MFPHTTTINRTSAEFAARLGYHRPRLTPSSRPAAPVARSLYRLTAENTLRACQSLCLYGQLPVQLVRTVLGQAFLDKTERQIQRPAHGGADGNHGSGMRGGLAGAGRRYCPLFCQVTLHPLIL